MKVGGVELGLGLGFRSWVLELGLGLWVSVLSGVLVFRIGITLDAPDIDTRADICRRA